MDRVTEEDRNSGGMLWPLCKWHRDEIVGKSKYCGGYKKGK